MKFVIAPDSFKESINAVEVAHAIEQGLRLHFPRAEYVLVPMADGGEGTLKSIMSATPGQLISCSVHDPLGNPHEAQFGIINNNKNNDSESSSSNDIAIIEMAEASGLHLVPKNDRNPMLTSSFGTGELILAALNEGCREFIIGLGSSATCDGGMGVMAALGLQYKDALGQIVKANGAGMSKVHSIDSTQLDPRLAQCHFVLAHDVDNGLLGLEGALMYAPQKGATITELEALHKGYEQLAHVLSETSGKSFTHIPGSGAAGGLGASIFAFLNAEFKPGAEVIMSALGLRDKMQDANLVITGEGQIDAQTIHGKTPIAVAKLAKTMNIPVIALTARLKDDYVLVYHHGIDAVFCITNGPMSQEESMALSKSMLIDTASNIARLINLKIDLYDHS
jgi:glycerate 2-kinase